MEKDYIMFRLNKETKKLFKKKCVQEELNMSYVLIDFVKNFINK